MPNPWQQSCTTRIARTGRAGSRSLASTATIMLHRIVQSVVDAAADATATEDDLLDQIIVGHARHETRHADRPHMPIFVLTLSAHKDGRNPARLLCSTTCAMRSVSSDRDVRMRAPRKHIPPSRSRRRCQTRAVAGLAAMPAKLERKLIAADPFLPRALVRSRERVALTALRTVKHARRLCVHTAVLRSSNGGR